MLIMTLTNFKICVDPGTSCIQCPFTRLLPLVSFGCWYLSNDWHINGSRKIRPWRSLIIHHLGTIQQVNGSQCLFFSHFVCLPRASTHVLATSVDSQTRKSLANDPDSRVSFLNQHTTPAEPLCFSFQIAPCKAALH